MRQELIRLLEDQPTQNFGNKNTKINIHLPVRGEILDYCISLNHEIRKITKSGVDFQPSSYQIPHLTLYMGFVENFENYKNVCNEIFLFSKELSRFEITPIRPYLKDPKNNYIFVDSKQTDFIIGLKRELKSRVEKYIQPLNWDVVGEVPHITVGYVKDSAMQINDVLKNYRIGPSWYGEGLEISYGGPWGSCLGSLRCFDFQS